MIPGAVPMPTVPRESMALTTSSPMGPPAREAAMARPRSSPAGRAERRACEDGFTLLEMVCALAVVALVAAIVFPAIPRATTRARLEGYAIEAAALLRADRNAAIRRRAPVATELSASGRQIRSGAGG